MSQRQILTPGLMQMVSVLALNKLELKDMIQAEIAENPVLEELEESVPLLDQVAGREAEREQAVAEVAPERKEVDPFEEIDFGSYFPGVPGPRLPLAQQFRDDRGAVDRELSDTAPARLPITCAGRSVR